MAKDNAKKESAWKVLALLGAIAAVLAYGFLFDSSFRSLVGLSGKPAFSFSLKGGKKAFQSGTRARASIPKEDLESFCDSLVSREVEVFILPKDEPLASGFGKLDGADAEEREDFVRSMWEVRVSGTFPDLEKNWLAIIQGQYCKAGRRLESRSEGRCAYQILEVGKKCVWMVPYDKKEGLPDLPHVEWPDVSFIVNDRVNGRLQPARVRFANGAEVGTDRAFKVSRASNVAFRVVKLFDNGVCFEAFEDGMSWFFACMVVAP